MFRRIPTTKTTMPIKEMDNTFKCDSFINSIKIDHLTKELKKFQAVTSQLVEQLDVGLAPIPKAFEFSFYVL